MSSMNPTSKEELRQILLVRYNRILALHGQSLSMKNVMEKNVLDSCKSDQLNTAKTQFDILKGINSDIRRLEVLLIDTSKELSNY